MAKTSSLDLGSTIRDADSKMASKKAAVCEELGIENKPDQSCAVHKNRNFPNKLWKGFTKKFFSKQFCGKKADPKCYGDAKMTSQQRTQSFKKHFIDASRRRVAAEFGIAHEKTRQSNLDDKERENELVRLCGRAARSIPLCFNGFHSRCDKWSGVCRATGVPDYVPSHLPNGEYLGMTKADVKTFYEIILAGKLGPKVVRAQRNNLNTNTTESRWTSTSKANPKGNPSIRNHVAKSVSGHLKYSTGRGLDDVRVAIATGVTISHAMVSRAISKRTRYAEANSKDRVLKRRRSRQKRRMYRQPVLPKAVAYKGKGQGD
jgi:hypothetical protein